MEFNRLFFKSIGSNSGFQPFFRWKLERGKVKSARRLTAIHDKTSELGMVSYKGKSRGRLSRWFVASTRCHHQWMGSIYWCAAQCRAVSWTLGSCSILLFLWLSSVQHRITYRFPRGKHSTKGIKWSIQKLSFWKASRVPDLQSMINE